MSKKKMLLIIGIIGILIGIIGVSFAFYIFNVSQEGVNIVRTDCFEITFSDNNPISLQKTIPLTESEGQDLIPYEFTIKNICNQAAEYDINIETLSSSTLLEDYIRYKLDNAPSINLGTITNNDRVVNENARSSKTIKSAILLQQEEVTYNLRMWIDEDATKEQSANKNYSSKVVIVSSLSQSPYYAVTLNKNNGEEEEIVNIVKGRTLESVSDPTKYRSNFDGWYSDIELTNLVEKTTPVTSDMTLYAKWSDSAYQIAYVNDNGVSNPTSYYDDSESFTLNNPTSAKTYCTFKGWSGTDLDGDENTNVTIATGSSGNRSYTANWTIDNTTIDYSANVPKINLSGTTVGVVNGTMSVSYTNGVPTTCTWKSSEKFYNSSCTSQDYLTYSASCNYTRTIPIYENSSSSTPIVDDELEPIDTTCSQNYLARIAASTYSTYITCP